MRKIWLLSLLFLSACPGKGGKGAAPDTGGTDGTGGSDDPGFFEVLTVPGSSWVLHDTMAEEEPQELVITVAAVRKLGDATVIELALAIRYSEDGDLEEQAGDRFAVTPRGLWQLDVEADDDAIAAVLAEPPHWPAPPVEIEAPVGRFMSLKEQAGEQIACLGEIPDLGDEECSEVCGGGMCIAERGGIVGLDGDWSPDSYAMFEQDAYRSPGYVD